MSNFAKVIKEEISRVARKEQRGASLSIKKASAAHRSEIAAFKRRVAALEHMIKKFGRTGTAPTRAQKPSGEESADGDVKLRFSAARLRAQRERQGLSAPALAKVIGVSAQTVYNWETGKGRPRPRSTCSNCKNPAS